uniref:Reverse transcriptase Ty1/copia-type domain-containing protein n=1 Tax=Tanacetum cinerariifolium TaxID=118510 RepID=A0A6L2LQW4_TANCI|nr:hypothetical protein [Tanacetum cinerariifolium]
MFGTVPAIPPPLGTSYGSTDNLNPNRVDTIPTNDIPNTIPTTNVGQNVVDENLPQFLDSRGGPFVLMSSLSTSDNPLPKRQNQWSNSKSLLANQDKRLKSIIISCLPNDVMKSDNDSDVEEDQRTNNELMADLNVEYHERALLANQKKFYSRSGRVGFARKPIEKTKETCFTHGKLEYCQSSKGIKGKYKRHKPEMVVLIKRINDLTKGKSEKGKNEKGKRITKIRAFMEIAEDEPSFRKADARFGQWVDITMKKADESSSMSIPEITSDSESECETQELLLPLPKLIRAAPVAILKSCSDKKADSSTEQLLLTLIEEESGPKVIFGDDSLGDTEGYGSVNCNGITFTKVAYVNGLKHNLIRISQLEKDIELVNIIREPLAGITTRSRARDSEAGLTHECLYVNFISEMEPKKLIEAVEEEGWIIAMQKELNQFERNNEGIDYEETFAPIARLEAIVVFLAYAAYIGFMVYQMNVKSSFLNGKILKEVYVQQPYRFKSNELPNHVCFQIKQDFKGMSIYQEKYVKDLLKKYELADSALVKCPMLPLNNLGLDESWVFANEMLADMIFNTPHVFVLGLWYQKGLGFDLKAFSDSDYAGCNLDRKTEAEYVAVAGCCA